MLVTESCWPSKVEKKKKKLSLQNQSENHRNLIMSVHFLPLQDTDDTDKHLPFSGGIISDAGSLQPTLDNDTDDRTVRWVAGLLGCSDTHSGSNFPHFWRQHWCCLDAAYYPYTCCHRGGVEWISLWIGSFKLCLVTGCRVFLEEVIRPCFRFTKSCVPVFFKYLFTRFFCKGNGFCLLH